MDLLEGRRKKKTDGRVNNGGARPGSGPKRKLEGGGKRTVYLDEITVKRMIDLGNGSISAGIRKAGELLSHSMSQGPEKPLNIVFIREEEE